MKIRKTALCILGGVLISSTASAELLWSDFSLSYLKGSNYEVVDPDQQTITVEHASAHNWGDNFFFLDRSKSDVGNTDTYFEVSPRLSLGYVSGADLSFGVVKDVFLAGTLESGTGFNNYMAGVGVSLDVPGFQYVNANVYQVINDKSEDDAMLTLTWGLPFTLSNAEFLYDGFVDWSSAKSDHAAETNFTSQLKWNAGKLIGTKAPVYVGVEYSHWSNKFGIKGADERNLALLLKWHF
jgi:nucleoside-specific outer membrane channel protein Tsx